METTYLSPKEFAAQLKGVSEKFVRRMVKQGVLPVLRSGRAVRIPLQAGIDALENYAIAEQRQQPKPYELKAVTSAPKTARPGKMTDIQRARIEAARKALGLENEGRLP